MTSDTRLFLVAVDGGQVTEVIGPYLGDDVIDSNRGIRFLRDGHPGGDVYCARTHGDDPAEAQRLIEKLLARRRT